MSLTRIQNACDKISRARVAEMPVQASVPIVPFDQESFHQVDKRITGLAFEIHNEFGRYLDERLYQRELVRRCRAAGFEVEPELRMTVSLDGFQKDYFADLLVNQGVIVEMKAVAGLGLPHTGQTLNYLFLCGLHHGTLLNFRTARVEHRFVSTTLTGTDRRQFELHAENWRPKTAACDLLHSTLLRLVNEWGAYLDPNLYRDAIVHFLGGTNRVEREVAVLSGSAVIGKQSMHLLTDDIAFSVTASTHHPESVLEHQRRLVNHTPLEAIHWINFNHKRVEFRTIQRS